MRYTAVTLRGPVRRGWSAQAACSCFRQVSPTIVGTVSRSRRSPERFLATILFTDIVGSTDQAVRLGDRAWQRLVAAHHRAVRRELHRYGGRELDTAGDGFFATFDQP